MSRLNPFLACGLIGLHSLVNTLMGQAPTDEFQTQVRPMLEAFCMDCHSADNMESGIRVDHLDGLLAGRTPFLWQNIRKQLSEGHMPPEDADQPSDEIRTSSVAWIDAALLEAKRRPRPNYGTVRRLTVAQYQSTIERLFGIHDDYTSLLPPDAVSKDGFLNRDQTMIMSPLLIEAYLKVAEKVLDRCIVDPDTRPTIQHVRLDFGRRLNTTPYPDQLILGPNSLLLKNEDFVVTQPKTRKPFEYELDVVRTKFRFNEGYQGNSTVRGWRDYDSIYHAVYACMRGDRGYPLGKPFSVVPSGLLLRPAIPNIGQFGISTTYGPKANFKVSLRQLPAHGDLRFTVRAAIYDDGILLDPRRDKVRNVEDVLITADIEHSREANVEFEKEGVYQIDLHHNDGHKDAFLQLTLGDRQFTGKLRAKKKSTAFLLVRIQCGPLRLVASYGSNGANNNLLKSVSFSRLADESDLVRRFEAFENRKPTLQAYLGLRRDCGSTQSPFADRQVVHSEEIAPYVFQDAINNHPRPNVQDNNDNYLAGLREVGLRSLYTDGRDMPRVLIDRVDIEGPYYESWPPKSHRDIFIASDAKDDHPRYAKEIISNFASKAYRRNVSNAELTSLMDVWRSSFEQSGDFQQSIKDSLLVVLTSPQFVFLIEESQSPEAEPLTENELASKLSFFLWNEMPDKRLLNAAAATQIREDLTRIVSDMIDDKRSDRFVEEFTTQWLSLDKLDVVATDPKRYPRLTSTIKTELKKEPVMLIRHLLRENRPISELIRSEYLIANELTTAYYEIDADIETGFDFQPVSHGKDHLGGVISQASILAALSDGREANPIKRGAWLARKILAEPPDDPPPNVPQLDEENREGLSLRERLERHRNQEGCLKCHSGIDPWGIPLQDFDAGGRFAENAESDTELPDKTRIRNSTDLKDYLAEDRIDQVAFSFLKHLATYATGRDLSFNEIEYLRESRVELRKRNYRVGDMLHFIVNSPLFLEK